jgi:MFS family permease
MNFGNKDHLLRDKNVYIIFSITLLAIMGVASLTPAFPEIIRRFGISAHEIGLLITVFTLPGIVLAPVMGVLADRLGRKTILLPSIFLYGTAGFLCAFTKDYQHLLIFRFFQGTGAAALGMINVTLVGDIYRGIRRATVMGYNASVLSIGTAAYPAIGGALAVIAWFYPFYLSLLAVPVGLFVIFGLKNPEPVKKQDFSSYLRNTWATINKRNVWALFALSILVFIILYGSYLTFLPLLLEERFNADAFDIGMVMSIMSIVTAVVSSQLGRLNRKFTAKKLLIYSAIFYVLALTLIAYANTWLVIFIAIVTFGCGHGLFIPNVQNLLVGYASINERAGFMSINSMVLRIGQTIGPVTVALFYNLGGLRYAFLTGTIVALIMVIISIVIITEPKRKS